MVLHPLSMNLCMGWKMHSKFRQFTSLSQTYFFFKLIFVLHVQGLMFRQWCVNNEGPLWSLLSGYMAMGMCVAFQTTRICGNSLLLPHSLDYTVQFTTSLSLCCLPQAESQLQAVCDVGLSCLFLTEIATVHCNTHWHWVFPCFFPIKSAALAEKLQDFTTCPTLV